MTNNLLSWAKALFTDSPHDRVAFWRGATAAMLLPAVGEVVIGDSLDLTGHLIIAGIFALIAFVYWYQIEIVSEPNAKTAEEIQQ